MCVYGCVRLFVFVLRPGGVNRSQHSETESIEADLAHTQKNASKFKLIREDPSETSVPPSPPSISRRTFYSSTCGCLWPRATGLDRTGRDLSLNCTFWRSPITNACLIGLRAMIVRDWITCGVTATPEVMKYIRSGWWLIDLSHNHTKKYWGSSPRMHDKFYFTMMR